ncbi:MAG TPA: heterodisulfide reductase-related iron-sulfur binding cluster [Usitatibacteraceae bacterium]|nr:heterodisulfide reductase-related iron-sulfur binding cluster [Usitatibacteraceae bacterium]
MSVREGNLEAPTRHPIDWKNPEYYDEAKLQEEMERVFGICHGCRRCVSLCGSFPKLFDLVDEGPTGEVDGVAKERYREVVDQCYLCDVCYMTKCPYVPPHPWNVDFPHLMLRAKAVKFASGKVPFRDKLLAATDALGTLATIPIVTQVTNALNRSGSARGVMESALGVDRNAWVPEYATAKFRSSVARSGAFPVRDGGRTPGKVAIFSTCYINYNEPGIGHDLAKILAHNEIPYVIAAKEACCGMPTLELGDLAAVAANKEKNIPALASLAREGYAILTPIPSCTLMFKQELPLLFPGDPDVLAVQEAMFDPFEYLVLRRKDGLLRTDFTTALGKVSYHVPCHSRVQKIGQKTREALEMVPGTTVSTVERCSGHSGTWGCKKEFHQVAMKIGRPVFRAMAEPQPDWISSDCQLGGRHIEQGMGDTLGKAQLKHPITLMRMAYGLPD